MLFEAGYGLHSTKYNSYVLLYVFIRYSNYLYPMDNNIDVIFPKVMFCRNCSFDLKSKYSFALTNNGLFYSVEYGIVG